jgi:hypothetical protein
MDAADVCKMADVSKEQSARWQKLGLQMAAEGKLGIVLMAGGDNNNNPHNHHKMNSFTWSTE